MIEVTCMINAKTARKIAQRHTNNTIKSTIREISRLIRIFSHHGETELIYWLNRDFAPKATVVGLLVEQGYRVETDAFPLGDLLLDITWD